MIKLSGIKVNYKNRLVLDVPHLALEPGKRYALIGVNGSGKTTLLRIIAKLLCPDAGEVENPYVNEMGYMPQVPYAFSFSVQQNIRMAFGRKQDVNGRDLDALCRVGIDHLSQSRGNRLSGGETQRMAFARMIALPRKLLLLDEPTASADIRGTDLIEKALQDYLSENACTLVFSTHSPAQTLRLADEVLFLDGGMIAERGAASDVIHAPKKENTRLFLKHWVV